jgi:hypothetical protein
VITISPKLEKLLSKLELCEDPETREQIFIGTIRVTVEDREIILDVEEATWETPGGLLIDTSYLRGRS